MSHSSNWRTPQVVVHLMPSPFFGGPERQAVGLASHYPEGYRPVFALFSEGGRGAAFLGELRARGLHGSVLEHDTPHLRSALREVTSLVVSLKADLICCQGYKADLLGLLASRRLGLPVVSVSRGWTGESVRIRLYEALDRRLLRRMDRVVCVSEGQAVKVRRAGVRADKVVVIRNAIRAGRFDQPDPSGRRRLADLFPEPPSRIIGAAGRLSPEKGFDVLIDAASLVARADPSAGFVLFGEGALRGELARRVADRGLEGRFLLAGFCADLDHLIPHLDLAVLSSHTEGLPNVALEALAAGVPVVATAVGGNPEVVDDGRDGFLVPAGDAEALSRRISDALASEEGGRVMGRRRRDKVAKQFTFEAQGQQYKALFDELARPRAGRAPYPDRPPAATLQGARS